eukprot:497267_1
MWLCLLFILQTAYADLWNTCKNEVPYVYGEDSSCEITVHMCKHDTSWYTAYAFSQGITGPISSEYSHAEPARHEAIYKYFSKMKNNITCNCYTTFSTNPICDVTITTCFDFKSLYDVSPPKLQYGALVTHANYQGYYCCSYDKNQSITTATQFLQAKIPSCFTTNPTYLPTSYPTMNPSNRPSMVPTVYPTFPPTMKPTNSPTESPTLQPSKVPSETPTMQPTDIGSTLNPTMNKVMNLNTGVN